MSELASEPLNTARLNTARRECILLATRPTGGRVWIAPSEGIA
jgi:hypothetical protein